MALIKYYIHELSTTDFSSIRSIESPSIQPTGIGGDDDTIWHCNFSEKKNYELSTTDFSVIRSADSPTTGNYGIGGDANVVWHCEGVNEYIYELDTTDLSVVRHADSPSSNPYGIGGTTDVLWHSDYTNGEIYELDAGVTPPVDYYINIITDEVQHTMQVSSEQQHNIIMIRDEE